MLSLRETLALVYPNFAAWVRDTKHYMYVPSLADIQLWEQWENEKRQAHQAEPVEVRELIVMPEPPTDPDE